MTDYSRYEFIKVDKSDRLATVTLNRPESLNAVNPPLHHGLLGMLNWLYQWYRPQGRLSIREVAEQFTAMALSGRAAPASKRRPARSRRR